MGLFDSSGPKLVEADVPGKLYCRWCDLPMIVVDHDGTRMCSHCDTPHMPEDTSFYHECGNCACANGRTDRRELDAS